MKLIVHNVISGFSGAEHSSLKIDLLFAGHIPQEELKANVIRAINSHAALIAALEEAQANLWSYQRYSTAMAQRNGMGHDPLTGRHGFSPDTLNQYIAQALADAKGSK